MNSLVIAKLHAWGGISGSMIALEGCPEVTQEEAKLGGQ